MAKWKPIVLNIWGEELSEFHPQEIGIGDDKPLSRGGIVGVHSCGFSMYYYQVTPAHSVLVCHRCFFRIHIPNTVATYGELRAYLQERIIRERQGCHCGECACA